MRWYGPNNATLTVCGDVKAADVVKLAEKYFGPILPCPAVKSQSFAPVILDQDRYISYEDNIRAPQLNFEFPTVAARNVDESALDILADVLAGSKSSIFYQNFVKSETPRFSNCTRDNRTKESICANVLFGKVRTVIEKLPASSSVGWLTNAC